VQFFDSLSSSLPENFSNRFLRSNTRIPSFYNRKNDSIGKMNTVAPPTSTFTGFGIYESAFPPIGEIGATICSRCEQFSLITLSAKSRSEEHTSELQSRFDLVCRLLLEKKKNIHT